jgi:hypothetical protein
MALVSSGQRVHLCERTEPRFLCEWLSLCVPSPCVIDKLLYIVSLHYTVSGSVERWGHEGIAVFGKLMISTLLLRRVKRMV